MADKTTPQGPSFHDYDQHTDGSPDGEPGAPHPVPPTDRPDDTREDQPAFRYVHTSNLPDLLERGQFSILVTTYQVGKVLAFSSINGRCSLLMRSFPHPMGVAVHGDEMALLCKNQIWHLKNRPDLFDRAGKQVAYDAYYVPRWSHVTGDIAGHEIAWSYKTTQQPDASQSTQDDPSTSDDRTLWIVNTRFSCLATLDRRYSFVPRWKPPFITTLQPEDRCHLNGLAMDDDPSTGRLLPRYVTALGSTDEPQGWRDNRLLGGCLIDFRSNEIIARNLCMPHSPRVYRDKVWFLESGTGELKTVDPRNGQCESVIRLPGFIRGLTFFHNLAFIGLSKARERSTFDGIPIMDRFDDLQCGVHVVNIDSGQCVASIEFQSGCAELFDVQVVPNVSRLGIVGFANETVDGIFILPTQRDDPEPRTNADRSGL